MTPLAFLQALVDRGMSWEDAAAMARVFETSVEEAVAQATAPKARSANAERQARFRDRKAKRNESATSNATDNVTSNAVGNVTVLPAALDKEKSPTPPKEINPTTLSTPALPDREQARQDLRRMAIEAKEAAGDALASMAVCPGIATISPLVALLKAEPPCDWQADILPAIEQAAAWHRSRDGPASMTSWTLAARKAVENRNRRLTVIPPPPESPEHGTPSPISRPDRRQAAFVERLSRVDAAMAAAVEPAAGRR